MLEGWGQGKISAFTDTDKNNCIKFELVKFATDKNGTGSGSSGGVPSVNTQGTTPRLKCTFSGCDDGEVECSVCDGDGGWEEYDTSTPNYTGVGGRKEWKRCSNCGGDGEVACRRCGGDGWMD